MASAYEAFSQIHVAVDNDGICVVSMNRAQVRNAFSRIMTFELDRAFSRAEADPAVKGKGRPSSSLSPLPLPC